MAKQAIDPGIGEKFNARSGRVLNKDGTFNVEQARFDFRRLHVFQYLIRISWFEFYLILFIAFVIANIAFACVYLALGPNGLKSADAAMDITPFWRCAFFSVHTMTTVGYGNLYPAGYTANILAGIEAMTGLLGFSIATGMVYGRFSRPTAKIIYSSQAIVTPHTNHTNALMFRIANLRSGVMMDIEASVLLTYIEKKGELFIRRYYNMELERSTVSYLPLSWTLVHPINEQSPLYGKNVEEHKHMMLEILVTIKGFDETYGDNVHSRYSYLYEDIVWGAKFLPSFHVQNDGAAVLDIDKIGSYEKTELHKPTEHHIPAS
jgi:inward rectifier potassium channel